MDDIISRKDAIDALNGRKTADQSPRGNARNTVIDWCIKLIKALPPAQPEPDWIPVTEGLPKVSGCYLVSVKNEHERRYSKTAWFEKGAWFARQDVIAWMPCPKPYKGE